MKESTRVLVALAAAIGGGALIAASGNKALSDAADALAPLGTMWVSAIRMTVIPLVVSLLITGVASATDVGAIGRLGGRTLVVFVLLLAVVAAIVVPLAPTLFALLPLPSTAGARPTLPAGAADAASQLSAAQTQTFGAWLTSLIPSNPIAAAANGAMVPLIVFTLILAVAIARSPDATRVPLVTLAGALGDAMLRVVRWVVLVAPIGVFALVLPIAVHLGGSVAGAIGVYILAYSLASVAVVLLTYPIVALFGGIPIGRFARAALPSQLIAFSSSSSIASLPALIESGERGLALPPRVTGFVLPLAVSTFKLAAPVSWTIGALFVGWFYGIPLHARELATVAFAAVFLAFAAPGVPRGAFIMLTPLFLAIGLPAEGIGILIAVDALPDTFATVLNVTGDLAAAAIVANADRRPQPMVAGAEA
ncbi:MAG TPA: cation:dicarboxylase symporter family transporter [Gemmatimonadaceae bacterium]|jgi:proton glutamate symport protein|nr:cation:dicarboxylase symporter family transporter [Gemmatimonadaceae bacterium]